MIKAASCEKSFSGKSGLRIVDLEDTIFRDPKSGTGQSTVSSSSNLYAFYFCSTLANVFEYLFVNFRNYLSKRAQL